MSDTESMDYLLPGFDPETLTVPKLRSALVAHDIQYPATAKKQQLVDIFRSDLVPKSKKILAQRARARRTSKGIVDAGSSQEAEHYESELAPPQSVRRSRSPRKSSVRPLRQEEFEEELPVAPRSTKRGSRASSRPLQQTSDFDRDVDVHLPARSNRRTVTPRIKSEEPDDDFFKPPRNSDVFSSDNPFQSGSSPPPTVKQPGNRRKTTGMDAILNNRDTFDRRRTDGYVPDTSDDFAVSRPVKPAQNRFTPRLSEPPTMEAGEEFTPEAQLELEQEMAAKGETQLAPRRPQASRRRLNLAGPLWAVTITLLGAYAAWYRQEKIAVGYCGLGRPATQILPPDVPVPDWAVPLVEPQCDPCPQHAICYEDYSTRCETDYILQPHPLSLGGLVPLPPTCEPDGEKVRRVKAVADKAVEELRERRAKWECGELVDEAGHQEETPAVEEQELKEVVSKKRSKRLNKQEFDDLWVAAIGEVKARDEIEVVEAPRNGNSSAVSNTYLTSTSLARVPIGCAIKRSIRIGLARHRFLLGSIAALAALVLYFRAWYRAHRAAVAKVPALVDLVLARLATQKELGEDDIDDPWLFLPNLRDDVLRSVHSLRERDKIWRRVRAVVEQNSNVRTSQREGRSGEVGRAWEWIGPISGDTARRRRSGRVSWGADVKTEDGPEMSENKQAAHSKWEESRPIY